jgi:hypothetical protein
VVNDILLSGFSVLAGLTAAPAQSTKTQDAVTPIQRRTTTETGGVLRSGTITPRDIQSSPISQLDLTAPKSGDIISACQKRWLAVRLHWPDLAIREMIDMNTQGRCFSRGRTLPIQGVCAVLIACQIGLWAHAQTTPVATNGSGAAKVVASPNPPPNVYTIYTVTATPPPAAAPAPAATAPAPAAADRGPKPAVTTISYKTKRDPATGVISIDSSKLSPSPKTIDIKGMPPGGCNLPPALGITATVTYARWSGTYAISTATNPTFLSTDHYTIDLGQFVTDFMSDVNALLPPAFDPGGTPNLATTAIVSFMVAPVVQSATAPPTLGKNSSTVNGVLTMTLTQVFGTVPK